MDLRLSKNSRILCIFEDLIASKSVNKATEAQRFGVDERSIQRDIDDIRAYLAEVTVSSGDSRRVIYDRKRKGFVLEGHKSPVMSNSEILAVCKILLGSRAFTSDEMTAILDKLVSGCVPQENMGIVADLIANERFHYVELTHPSAIQEKLWEIGNDIRHHRLMKLTYQRQGETDTCVQRIVAPAALLFSEYYFYLNAYIMETDNNGGYVPKYNYPAIFRVDRINEYCMMDVGFNMPYADRFQEGEFRKRVQFMYPGRLQSIRFRYTGTNVDAILDRLPTAMVIETGKDYSIVEAEVYGKGILMWLLSQGERVEILSPKALRYEMCDLLQNILKQYQKD